MSVQITTNNVPRELVMAFDLSEKEREDFDYIGEEDSFSPRIFRYKGNLYDTGDCETVTINLDFGGWDGYFSETFFSGVLFKYVPDTDYEEVIVGRYFVG